MALMRQYKLTLATLFLIQKPHTMMPRSSAVTSSHLSMSFSQTSLSLSPTVQSPGTG